MSIHQIKCSLDYSQDLTEFELII